MAKAPVAHLWIQRRHSGFALTPQRRPANAPLAPHQVDDHVLVEGGPPLSGHAAHVHDGLGVVGVDMEDGSIDDPRHVRGVGGGAGHPGVRRKANLRGDAHIALDRNDNESSNRKIDVLEIYIYIYLLIVMFTRWLFHRTIQYLVVDHHVDCTMCGVGRQLAEVEGLVHNSLPSESCVTVYQDGHHLGGTGLQSQLVT